MNDLTAVESPGSKRLNRAGEAGESTTNVTNGHEAAEGPEAKKSNQAGEVDEPATDGLNNGETIDAPDANELNQPLKPMKRLLTYRTGWRKSTHPGLRGKIRPEK